MRRFVRSLGRARGLAVVAFVLFAWTAHAQTITDPRRVEFTPSADHDAIDTSGVPLVQSYTLQIYPVGATQPVQTVQLGKPALDTDGKIRVDFVSLLASPLTGGVNYEGRVSANGPGGSTTSLPSNTFSFTIACAAPTISPASQSIAAGGGAGSTTVTAGAGCAWTAVSNTGWITVTSGAAASGPAVVTFVSAANTGTSSRTGTLTVAGKTFTVTQAGLSCTSTLSPASQSFSSTGGGASVDVSLNAGCGWTAVSNNNWITVSSGASGSGPGTVGVSVAAYTGTTTRTGTVTIAGKTFTVTQTGVSCTSALSPGSQSFASTGGTGNIDVTMPAGCAWTAVSNNNWITITAGASTSGPGNVSFSVGNYTGTTTRTGTMTIAGKTFTVTETGVSCTFSISPTSQSVSFAGDTGSIAVTAPTGCAWTATANNGWLSVAAGASGSGNDSVTFAATRNPSTSARNGTLTVAGKTFTVNQAGAPCAPTIAPVSQTFNASGGSGSATVDAATGCAWTAVSNSSWITVTAGASSSGDGTATFSVAANSTATPRNGSLTIGGNNFTVTQSAVSCTPSISPTSKSVAASGGTGTATVTAPTGCAWSATSPVSWVTITSGASGSGNGTVGFSAVANPTTSARNTTLTIAGKSFTVTQPGSTCSFTVTPTSLNLPINGGSGSFSITTSSGCSWTSSSPVNWIGVAGAKSSSGIATYLALSNANNPARTTTITIAGIAVTVTQAGLPPPPAPKGLRIVGGR